VEGPAWIVRFVDVEEEVDGIVTGVKYPELPTVDVLEGAEGIEVIFPEVVVFEVEFEREDELDKKDVVKCPPKYKLVSSEFGVMTSTGPFRPPKGIVDHDEVDVDQSATFPPDPEGAENSPPTQTCLFESSQYRVFTNPPNPLERGEKVPVEIEYEAIFVVFVVEIDVNNPPRYNVPFVSAEFAQHIVLIAPPMLVFPKGL
jgi:hypothetical protein